MRILALGMLLAALWSTAVTAQDVQPVQRSGVTLDRGGLIPRALLLDALNSLEAHEGQTTNRRRIAIVDLARHSASPRFYVLNLTDGSVRALVTTHGAGSDPEPVIARAIRASNVPGSDASSIGAYVTGEHYYSDTHHSRAVRLDGLDKTNSNARCRCIVVHAAVKGGANYASTAWIRQNGHAGRSNGCFAFSNEDIAYVLDRLEPGTFLYAGPRDLTAYRPEAKQCACGGTPTLD